MLSQLSCQQWWRFCAMRRPELNNRFIFFLDKTVLVWSHLGAAGQRIPPAYAWVPETPLDYAVSTILAPHPTVSLRFLPVLAVTATMQTSVLTCGWTGTSGRVRPRTASSLASKPLQAHPRCAARLKPATVSRATKQQPPACSNSLGAAARNLSKS